MKIYEILEKSVQTLTKFYKHLLHLLKIEEIASRFAKSDAKVLEIRKHLE